MDLEVRPATGPDVEEFVAWRYEPPYDVYDITDPLAVDYFLRTDVGCHVIVAKDDIVGFCTFGTDAQVPGGDYSEAALDIGLGLRPDLTGRGLSRHVLPEVIALAEQRFPAGRLRVTIAAANGRAVAAWTRSGFTEVERFRSTRNILGSDDFVILVR